MIYDEQTLCRGSDFQILLRRLLDGSAVSDLGQNGIDKLGCQHGLGHNAHVCQRCVAADTLLNRVGIVPLIMLLYQ